MSKVFDQDAPETQLGFKEAQEKAERLYAEFMQEVDTTGDEADVLAAEKRFDIHLIKFRHLLGDQEQWARDYRVLDGLPVVSSQELGL